ncbi:MAG: DNA repair protein RecO [Myxococcales bacterium]|nr:DNA repair protein RecO [Myxococcales bacterium]
MATLRSEALILRSVDFGESDRILHLLLPDQGRLTVIAKGARRSLKRFSGTLDLFNHLSVQVEGRRRNSMARLEQARLIRGFAPLRVDPMRFALGCYLLELLDRLAPEGGVRADMQQLFSFALDALQWVAARPPDLTQRTILELRALDALGLRPELRDCVRCKREVVGEGEQVFHVAEGGPLCGTCAVSLEGLLSVHVGTLRALQQGLSLDLGVIDRLSMGPSALAEARRLVTRLQHFHVGMTLQSERFLDRLFRESGISPSPAETLSSDRFPVA